MKFELGLRHGVLQSLFELAYIMELDWDNGIDEDEEN